MCLQIQRPDLHTGDTSGGCRSRDRPNRLGKGTSERRCPDAQEQCSEGKGRGSVARTKGHKSLRALKVGFPSRLPSRAIFLYCEQNSCVFQLLVRKLFFHKNITKTWNVSWKKKTSLVEQFIPLSYAFLLGIITPEVIFSRILVCS